MSYYMLHDITLRDIFIMKIILCNEYISFDIEVKLWNLKSEV